MFSYARSKETLKTLAREAHGTARAGTPGEAAGESDVLLLAVHWSRFEDVLRQAGDLSDKPIMSCSLPMNADDTELVAAHISSGAEELARMLPKARVVSAFNTVPSEVLFGVYQPSPLAPVGFECERGEAAGWWSGASLPSPAASAGQAAGSVVRWPLAERQ